MRQLVAFVEHVVATEYWQREAYKGATHPNIPSCFPELRIKGFRLLMGLAARPPLNIDIVQCRVSRFERYIVLIRRGELTAVTMMDASTYAVQFPKVSVSRRRLDGALIEFSMANSGLLKWLATSTTLR